MASSNMFPARLSFQGTAELTVKATTGQGTDAHEADTTMAPAWGVSGSYATSPLPDASRL